jgi:hypothetical protein
MVGLSFVARFNYMMQGPALSRNKNRVDVARFGFFLRNKIKVKLRD